jgi:hypothetical protein
VFPAFAGIAILVAADAAAGSWRMAFAGAMIALLLSLALRFPAGAAAAAGAAFLSAGTLGLWPVAAEIAAEPVRVLPQLMGPDARPEALEAYLVFGLVSAFAIAGGSLWRIAQGRDLPLATAAWFAGAATLGPLAALVVAWARVSGLATSPSFAITSGALALAFCLAAGALRRIEGETLDGVRLGLGATASAAVAALALGLTFALDRGMLTGRLGARRPRDRLGVRPHRDPAPCDGWWAPSAWWCWRALPGIPPSSARISGARRS